MITEKLKEELLNAQRNEITEHFIYRKLSNSTKDPHNRDVLRKIADEELKHYHFWKRYTKCDVKPKKLKIWFYYLIASIFGLTFGIRLMERGEGGAQISYARISEVIPEARKVLEDEEVHENQLIGLINEEFLEYTGSVVLGLSDALVELTGVLVGLTIALNNVNLIILTAFLTGTAASISMGASEFLATSEEGDKNPLKASVYTGLTYLVTVFFLLFPYLLFTDPKVSLVLVVFNAIVLILLATFYISVAKDMPFKTRFLKMAGVILGVSTLTFCLGLVVREVWHVEV
jgi:VIT1/CCC1 family predicted Fe2+/Mn2+ transporter